MVIYNDTVKEARLDVVIAAIDAGASFGYLEIGTAGFGTILATVVFEDPSATATADVLTIAGVPIEGVADNTGEAAEARIRDSDDNDIVTGLTVGVGTGNVQLLSTSIVQGQLVTLLSGTITHG
jgi:hypothetical protein